MLKIGYFSKISQVPVKTLRYYDEIGLLTPSQIDRFTNYRYYTFEQLPQLHTILALKELGLSLEQIHQMLHEKLSEAQVTAMIRLRQTQLLAQVNEMRAQLRRVEVRLAHLEKENKMPKHEVVLKALEPIQVAARRVTVAAGEESVALVSSAFAEIYNTLSAQSTKVTGPGLTVWHTPAFTQNDEDIEIAVPIAGTFIDTERIQSRLLPAATVASVTHYGLFDATFGDAYRTILHWIEANGYHITGPFREIYLHYEEDESKESTTEIQFPVERV